MTRLITVILAMSFMASTASAEKFCATFDQFSIGTIFANPGEVLFRDEYLEIRTAGFPTGYGRAEVIQDNGIGVSKQVVTFNNASFHLVSTVPFEVANAQIRDQGGFEILGVMGAFPMDVELHDSPSIVTQLAKIDGGINKADGVGRIHWETTTDRLLFSVTAGGQEFTLGEICIETL